MTLFRSPPTKAENPLDSTGQCFILPGDLNQLNGLREDSLSFLRNAGLDSESIESWALVLTEAFVNAVRHGSAGVEDAHVVVEWRLFPERVLLEISDQGQGVPPDMSEKRELPEDPLDENGRGLFLISSFCDATAHWTGSKGHLFCMERHHPGFDPQEAVDAVFNSTMEELSASYESLSAFYRLGEAMVQADKVTAFIQSAQVDMHKLVPSDYFSMSWFERMDDSLFKELNRMEHSLAQVLPSDIIDGVSATGSDFVFENNKEVAQDRIFSGFTSGCCLPIQAGGKIFGSFNLARKTSGKEFKAKDLNTLRTYADLFGIAVAHANNTITRTREQQALREIEIAAELQETLVPTAAPGPCPEWTLFLRRLSARSVSGDYTEAIQLPDGRLFLVIVDVMGKGVSAAFLAGMVRTAIRLTLSLEADLNTLIHRLNFILCLLVGDLTLFATAAFAMISKDRKSAAIANAGHCPVLIGREGIIREQVEPSGPPLGLFSDQGYEVERFSLKEGDWVLMITDGLYEWEIGENQIWGWDSFLGFTKMHIKMGGAEFWNQFQKYRLGHARETQLEDDQTLIYYRREL